MTQSLQTVLALTTERLARELGSPGVRPPDWSAEEWAIARAVVAMHGVGPLLARRLPWRGPEDWCEFLEQQHAATQSRQRRIVALLAELDRAARAAGVALLALKGAALHALAVYAPGERPMADVDLLVRPAQAAQAARMIAACGYRELHVSWKERAFGPIAGRAPQRLGEGAANDIKIELHERICERLPWYITDITAAIWPTSPAARIPGVTTHGDLPALMLHLLLHAAGCMAYQSLRLLHLHDIAALSRRMTDADWRAVLNAGAPLWWAQPPLRMTDRYFAAAIPSGVLAALARDCPWHLARVTERKVLTDVSFSHLWVDALPGAEWCRTLMELSAFAVRRVRPTRAQRELRAATLHEQSWANGSDWLALRHDRRVWRWLTSRQMRPVALHAINSL